MAKRKTGKKVEFYNWIMYTLSLARAIKFKIKRDTCNVYKLKLNRHPPLNLWLHVVYHFLHNGHLQPRRDATGHALKRNRYQLRWIRTRTPTKLKRYLIQKDEIITQACQVECSNVDPKIINVYRYFILGCSNMSSVFRMTVFWTVTYKIASTSTLAHGCSWENYFNHSWVYGILKLFFLLQGLGLIESKLQHI